MEEHEKIKCVLCCKNLNSVDTSPESFKASVKNLWDLCNTSFTESQTDLFEAGAFSQLKFCFDCRGMIEDAVSLHQKLKSLMGCIQENAKKQVEDEVEWPFKQFRAELKVALSSENRMRTKDLNVETERLNTVQTETGAGDVAGGAFQAETLEPPTTAADEPPAFKKLKKANKKPMYRPCTCQMSLPPKKNYGYVRKPSTNHPCDLCIVVCPTSAIAELHRKEVHQGMPNGSLSYHCENCDKILNAVDYCVNDGTLGSVFRLSEGQSHQNFKKFYMLCMAHFKDCKKRVVFAPTSVATAAAVENPGTFGGDSNQAHDLTDVNVEFVPPVMTGLASNVSTDSGQEDLPVMIAISPNDGQEQIVTSES